MLIPPHLSQRRRTSMLNAWILLFSLISGGGTFMIHSSQRSLCLEEEAETGHVLLQKCDLNSDFQQWLWISPGLLMCSATSRCLSSGRSEPVQARPCQGPDVDPADLTWDCDNGRIISRNTGELLSVDGQRLSLTKHGRDYKWKSLDQGDICQEKLRLRRAPAGDQDEYEDEELGDDLQGMTKEQREYLRWYYRTEDPTMWKFVMLGLAFVSLLIGFLLLGMGAMANKSRKKIAKYKAAASLVRRSEGEELIVTSQPRDNGAASPPLLRSSSSVTETNELKAGNIAVTWKDGNTSQLYSDSVEEEKDEEEKQDEEEMHDDEDREEKLEQASDAEQSEADGVKESDSSLSHGL